MDIRLNSRVYHVKDQGGMQGTVVQIDSAPNYFLAIYKVTTCAVKWDSDKNEETPEICWTNKLILV